MCPLSFRQMCGRGLKPGNAWVTGWLWNEGLKPCGGISLSRSCFTSVPPHRAPFPSASSSSPSLRHTRHQSSQCLHISQQINSVEHSPCRELSNTHCGPPCLSFFFFHPLSSALDSESSFSLRVRRISEGIDSCPPLFPRLPRLASSLLPNSPRCATALGPHREEQHVCSAFAEGAIEFLISHLAQLSCAKRDLMRRGCSSIQMIPFINFQGMTFPVCHPVT